MTTNLRNEEACKHALESHGALQRTGEIGPCPRCGYRPMNPRLMLNALSRHADVYICESCGMEEAMMDAAHKPPLSLVEWAIFRNERATRDTFASAVPDIRNKKWVKQLYALGLMLDQECPDNDCVVYKNTFNMARELDGAIEIVSGYPATVLERRLHEKIGELRGMWMENPAILAYRAQHFEALNQQ